MTKKLGRPKSRNPRQPKLFTLAPKTMQYLDYLRSQGINQSAEIERLIQASEMYRVWEGENG